MRLGRWQFVWNGRTVGALLAVAVVATGIYLFLWGKAFPYSPVILGFDRYETDRLVLYMEQGGPADMYNWADDLVPGVEAFHDLRFQRKPRVFFFCNLDTYARRSLSQQRMCTFYNGDIVVSPWVQREDEEGTQSLRIYLRHELSHSLLFQNMGFRARLRYPRWLMEGLATYSAGQLGAFDYPGREETFALIRAGNWMPPTVYRTPEEKQVVLDVPLRMPFVYSEFACIVEDLIDRFGRDTFLLYMKRLMTEPDPDTVFRSVFHTDFPAYLDGFQARIHSD